MYPFQFSAGLLTVLVGERFYCGSCEDYNLLECDAV